MFTERLDHTRALYFTITVFSTVGFGDITPRADLARIIVSIQMLLDLVILGSVVRAPAPQRRPDRPHSSARPLGSALMP
jgi:hypothetical protein